MTKNLDAIINELSYKIAEKVKNENDICDKLLGVLANDGPYAYVLYLYDKAKKNSKNEKEALLKGYEELVFDFFFGDNGIFKNYKVEDNSKEKKNLLLSIQNLSKDLSSYLYFKTILEKILIYVRYHLKTLKTDND